MMEYLAVKWLHVLASTLLFGTGVGSAFYLLLAVRHGDVGTIARVAGWVVIADGVFTATTAIAQPLTGFYLAHLAGLRIGTTSWLRDSVVLYVIAIACWLPVVVLQIRLRDLARAAHADATPLPARFHRYFRTWFALGFAALCAFLLIFWLMVTKQTPW